MRRFQFERRPATASPPVTVAAWAASAPTPVERDAPMLTTTDACAAGAPDPVERDVPAPAAAAACAAGAPVPADELRPTPADDAACATSAPVPVTEDSDRKSTRLNSSHMSISYAVFCL